MSGLSKFRPSTGTIEMLLWGGVAASAALTAINVANKSVGAVCLIIFMISMNLCFGNLFYPRKEGYFLPYLGRKWLHFSKPATKGNQADIIDRDGSVVGHTTYKCS